MAEGALCRDFLVNAVYRKNETVSRIYPSRVLAFDGISDGIENLSHFLRVIQFAELRLGSI